MNLLDDRDDAGTASLNVNKTFAAKYDAKKRGEELSKLKDKYGSDYDEDEDSTDYSSEDSDAEFVTPQVDAAILKIIGRIREGGSDLYQDGKDFFDEEETSLARAPRGSKDKKKQKKTKTVKLRDFQRNALLAGVHNNENGDDDELAFRTPAQEAVDLRAETKAAFLNAVDGGGGDASDANDDDSDDLLVRRDARGDSDEDEDQYRRFLLENVGAEEVEKALAIRRENERKVAGAGGVDGGDEVQDDEFLKNYILNRGWLDKKAKHIPTYAEIVPDDEDSRPAPGPSGVNATRLLGDEDSGDEFDKAEEFENRYNFRFEEQAGGEIQTHGRDAGVSIRRVDDSRKKTREATALRKAEEKQERMEDLKRLKNLKKQEILEKIAKIREVAGAAEGFDFAGLDLEEDYDPDSHAAKMAKVFNDDFYGAAPLDEDGKPIWDDDIDVSDIVPADKHDEAYAPGGEAYDPTETGQSGKKTRAERKKDKKSKKKDKGKQREEAAEGADEEMQEEEQYQANADFNPEDFDNIADPEERKAKIEQFLDEYYKLDYEDMIGDLPTRFHYTSSSLNPSGTQADPGGLTAVEILMATEAELNEYESLKKLAPYRQGREKEGGNKKRKKLKELRKKIAMRKWGDELPDEDEEAARSYHSKKRKLDSTTSGGGPANGEPVGPPKKRVGKKERQKQMRRAELAGEGQAEE